MLCSKVKACHYLDWGGLSVPLLKVLATAFRSFRPENQIILRLPGGHVGSMVVSLTIFYLQALRQMQWVELRLCRSID